MKSDDAMDGRPDAYAAARPSLTYYVVGLRSRPTYVRIAGAHAGQALAAKIRPAPPKWRCAMRRYEPRVTGLLF